jgi:hypothetical protein
VFTARYALSPYIKQIHFVFKGLMNKIGLHSINSKFWSVHFLPAKWNFHSAELNACNVSITTRLESLFQVMSHLLSRSSREITSREASNPTGWWAEKSVCSTSDMDQDLTHPRWQQISSVVDNNHCAIRHSASKSKAPALMTGTQLTERNSRECTQNIRTPKHDNKRWL